MGTDVADLVERPSSLYSFKVHNAMCTELMILAYRIEKILPDIEAARPRCQSGIQALCSLRKATARAKEYLQNCCDSSKLYLAITGDVISSRFQKSRDLFIKNLDQLQTMVPVMLVAEITGIIDDLKGAKLVLDSSEDGAGKAMRELLQLTPASSVEIFEKKALQLAASRLRITSSRAILVEERSIKNLLNKIGSNDPKKKTILSYLLRLLKKYRNEIMAVQPEGSFSLVNSFEVEGARSEQTHILTRATPPEEFKCPISMRMMYDPVVIASGITFERIWIQKWFDEGNDTCFKTKLKLSHRLLTPNATIKDLISKWCEKHGITIQDPSLEAFQSLDISTTSISSLGSFANNLQLPLDTSNVSLGSLDDSYSSDSTRNMVTNGPRFTVIQKASGSPRQDSADMSEKHLDFLSGLDELPWESKLELVEDVNNHLQNDQVHYYSLSSKNFVDPLVNFLRDSLDQNDVRAQRTGAKLLLAFAERNSSVLCRREGVSDLHEDTFIVLSSFLQSEITHEVLAILELLSCYPHYGPRIAASGALSSMLKILDSKSKESHEQAIKILQNLSSNNDICSQIVSLEFIPKLVPFINDKNLATYCIVVLKNLCQSEEAFVSVAETSGCISSIADLLESGSLEDQEHAVGILLLLCSQRFQYCKLIMDESLNIVPSLVHLSVNGNNKGKGSALELLRQLRNIYVEEQQFCGPDTDSPEDSRYQFEEKKPSSKPSGFFKKMFAKRNSLASKRK